MVQDSNKESANKASMRQDQSKGQQGNEDISKEDVLQGMGEGIEKGEQQEEE